MPNSVDFDNQLLNIDLLYSSPQGLYFGAGYSSYSLPVQVNCLVWDDSRGSVWWAPDASLYQPDMKFSIYSFLLGFDTLHDALFQKGIFGTMPSLSIWAWTQDRFGVGYSVISDEVKDVIEEANGGLNLWSANQIAMMVDYNLTLGVQFVKQINRFHLGI